MKNLINLLGILAMLFILTSAAQSNLSKVESVPAKPKYFVVVSYYTYSDKYTDSMNTSIRDYYKKGWIIKEVIPSHNNDNQTIVFVKY